MPAAAVIPAPIAYIKVAAVKKLVVGFLAHTLGPVTVRCMCVTNMGPSLSSYYHNFTVDR